VSTVTDRVLEHGRALVRAIEAPETIEPTGPIGRLQATLASGLSAPVAGACRTGPGLAG
jgi:hypothetical protein